MQLQKTNSGGRKVSPKRTAKARGQSSNKNANASRSVENATRSFRQTAVRGDNAGTKSGARSKKDNQRSGAKATGSARIASKRPSPINTGTNAQAKRRAPQGARRAKELMGLDKGAARPKGGAKGSSAKRARSGK